MFTAVGLLKIQSASSNSVSLTSIFKSHYTPTYAHVPQEGSSSYPTEICTPMHFSLVKPQTHFRLQPDK